MVLCESNIFLNNMTQRDHARENFVLLFQWTPCLWAWCWKNKWIYQPKLQFMIFKIRYNVGMAAPGHVAKDSTADHSTQHGRPLRPYRLISSFIFSASWSQARFTLKEQQKVFLCMIPLKLGKKTSQSSFSGHFQIVRLLPRVPYQWVLHTTHI